MHTSARHFWHYCCETVSHLSGWRYCRPNRSYSPVSEFVVVYVVRSSYTSCIHRNQLWSKWKLQHTSGHCEYKCILAVCDACSKSKWKLSTNDTLSYWWQEPYCCVLLSVENELREVDYKWVIKLIALLCNPVAFTHFCLLHYSCLIVHSSYFRWLAQSCSSPDDDPFGKE